jgi:hypothetical protein
MRRTDKDEKTYEMDGSESQRIKAIKRKVYSSIHLRVREVAVKMQIFNDIEGIFE